MTDSVTMCAFTADPTDALLFRLSIEPSKGNGLRAMCRLMVDKITTVPKTKIGTRIVRLDDEDMVRPESCRSGLLGHCRADQRREIEIESVAMQDGQRD